VRHRSDAYSAEQVPLNKRQIYGGAPYVNCYRLNLPHWTKTKLHQRRTYTGYVNCYRLNLPHWTKTKLHQRRTYTGYG